MTAMNTILLMLICFFGYIFAYHTYGRFLSQKVFSCDPSTSTPAQEYADGEDYVPSTRQVLFGHHFTSIAGTGPIVGPAIGVIWGWLPALLWVFLGSILMGAVHDFVSLMISMRNKGVSIADLSEKYINHRVKRLFYLVMCLSLLIVIAIFGLVIAIIFAQFPDSVFPVWIQIPIAIFLGIGLKKFPKQNTILTITSITVLYLCVYLGTFVPFTMPQIFYIPATGVWTILLLLYAYVASTLPVTTLLQPRDYLNAWQLYIALGLMSLGAFVSGIQGKIPLVAPALNIELSSAPPMWPFLFITIACGAISGFHALVSSGTSSKQISTESDAQFIGYGSMILEAGLATLIIIAVTAGIGMAYPLDNGNILSGFSAWQAHYSSWVASAGLGSKLNAVVIGLSNMMQSIGLSQELGIVIVGMFIASFAGTTLDTATRIQRYLISELFKSSSSAKSLSNKWSSSSIAVITAAILAFSSGADGKGALLLWPLFGAVNQLLAVISLLVGTRYLQKNHPKYTWITLFPCLFMGLMTTWASILNQINFIQSEKWIPSVLNFIIVACVLIIILEVIFLFRKEKQRRLSI